MNAASKLIHQSILFQGSLSDVTLSKSWALLLVLMFSVVATALGVVYVTNACRMSVAYAQQLEQEANQFELQWGQLLLEQASLGSPARVQALAMSELGMQLPSDKQTFVLQPS